MTAHVIHPFRALRTCDSRRSLSYELTRARREGRGKELVGEEVRRSLRSMCVCVCWWWYVRLGPGLFRSLVRKIMHTGECVRTHDLPTPMDLVLSGSLI